MDDDDEDDFDFSDSDLDHLPENVLHHLEITAIHATQHQPSATAQVSDYGLDEGDEVVNLDDDAGPERTQSYNHNGDSMLSRIKKLEQEKAREKKEAQDLKGKLQTKAGEADTLRRRQEAESRRHERQIADQQQLHASELAKMRAEIEKLRRDKDQAQIDSMFNQHDAREVGMARRTRKAMLSRPGAATTTAPKSPRGTPKAVRKTNALLGDGFDDEDIIMASPSKARERLKSATPKQIGKRKHQVTDQSPIPLPALQLSESRSQRKDKEQDSAVVDAKIDTALLEHLRHDDHRFTLLHRLLSHPSSNSEDRILEALAQHSFPTQPAKKLSSLVHDALAATTVPDVHQLALQTCHIFLNLWKRCLDEKYYAPISLVLDAMHFILASEPVDIAVQVAERAVPLIISSVDLVSLPISNAAKLGGKAVTGLYSPAQVDIASKIDVLDCLELLYLIATSSVSSTDFEALTRLWQGIPSGFALMLLNEEHPQLQITLMLRILSTSAISTPLSDSLGPIATEDESQANIEDALINRLTNMFIETPKPIPNPSTDSPPSPITEQEIWNLRLLVLAVLTQFSIPESGSKRLAQNPLCIGRLIKYLDHSINTLIKHPLSPTQDQKVASINATMKLIYHIATTNPGFDIKSKLVNTLGGQHAYLVALTRLAFSEGLVLEAGIEDAVVDMAHSILDEGLSMEEGEAFGMVFSSGT